MFCPPRGAGQHWFAHPQGACAEGYFREPSAGFKGSRNALSDACGNAATTDLQRAEPLNEVRRAVRFDLAPIPADRARVERGTAQPGSLRRWLRASIRLQEPLAQHPGTATSNNSSAVKQPYDRTVARTTHPETFPRLVLDAELLGLHSGGSLSHLLSKSLRNVRPCVRLYLGHLVPRSMLATARSIPPSTKTALRSRLEPVL